MSTLTKLALGMMGRLRPKPAQGDASKMIALPAPQKEGGTAVMSSFLLVIHGGAGVIRAPERCGESLREIVERAPICSTRADRRSMS